MDINSLAKFLDQNPGSPVTAVLMVYNRPPFAIVSTTERGVLKPNRLFVGCRMAECRVRGLRTVAASKFAILVSATAAFSDDGSRPTAVPCTPIN